MCQVFLELILSLLMQIFSVKFLCVYLGFQKEGKGLGFNRSTLFFNVNIILLFTNVYTFKIVFDFLD